MTLLHERGLGVLLLAMGLTAGNVSAQATHLASDSSFRAFLPTYEAAILAALNGDVVPLHAIESHAPDVSLLSPFGPIYRGYVEVSAQYERVAARMERSPSNALHVEYIAVDVSSDMAGIVAIERSTWTPKGGPAQSGMTRVTMIFRREDEGWKLVHRHMDHVGEAS
jgi:ketosteroid isomerase-like protein